MLCTLCMLYAVLSKCMCAMRAQRGFPWSSVYTVYMQSMPCHGTDDTLTFARGKFDVYRGVGFCKRKCRHCFTVCV